MEIVVHGKNSLFQSNTPKKLYHFSRHELGLLVWSAMWKWFNWTSGVGLG